MRQVNLKPNNVVSHSDLSVLTPTPSILCHRHPVDLSASDTRDILLQVQTTDHTLQQIALHHNREHDQPTEEIQKRGRGNADINSGFFTVSELF